MRIWAIRLGSAMARGGAVAYGLESLKSELQAHGPTILAMRLEQGLRPLLEASPPDGLRLELGYTDRSGLVGLFRVLPR